MVSFFYNYLRFTFCRHYGTLPQVRVRFAPSPTGFLHLGGLRTAFLNYLFARKNKGKFILRIEDTDQKRIKPGSVENLHSMLQWTGLLPDESPFNEGPYGPYVQSQRLHLYREKVDELLKNGAAYRCFCSETRLDILKKEALRQHVNWGYDNKCRNLDATDIEHFLKEGKSFTVRFKIPKGPVTHEDLVFKTQTYDVSENEGDFIIMKSDGFPTYHFACVVDDHLMEISHVLRGTEWLISTSKHILLHQALGWKQPKFAHLPLLTNSDRTKLSKRQESIGIENFKKKGYSSEALLNFLANAGGGFGKQEGCDIHNLETLALKFNLENVNMGSCIVDLRKLDLFNHNYLIQQLSTEESTSNLIKELRKILRKKYGSRYEKEEVNLENLYIKKIILCYKDRMNTLEYLTGPDMEYLWTSLEWVDILEKISALKIQEAVLTNLAAISSALNSIPDLEFAGDKLQTKLKQSSKDLQVPHSALMRALRVILTAQKDGPGVAEILEMLGKKRTVEKINFVTEKLDIQRKSNLCNAYQ